VTRQPPELPTLDPEGRQLLHASWREGSLQVHKNTKNVQHKLGFTALSCTQMVHNHYKPMYKCGREFGGTNYNDHVTELPELFVARIFIR
jgi:hypothetical protein